MLCSVRGKGRSWRSERQTCFNLQDHRPGSSERQRHCDLLHGFRSIALVVMCVTVAGLSAGCGDFFGKHGSYEFDDVTQTMAPDPHLEDTGTVGTVGTVDTVDSQSTEESRGHAGLQEQTSEAVHDEQEMEDPTPLIRELLAKEAGEGDGAISEDAVDYGPVLDVATAEELWRLNLRQCTTRLKKAGVAFARPTFTTPGVDMPLILTGPVAGVEIRPRWSKAKKTKEVMDCRLVLGLLSLAKYARTLGVEQVLYYTAYRPIKKLPKKCLAGKQSPRCQRLRKARAKARKSPSWHLKALAIDIRWFVLKNGDWLDVLEHYDRRDGVSPCSYTATTEQGRLLQDLACTLHRNRVFNVMLTPNVNPDHHNHFHFDITPKAKWYIIR